MPPSVIDLPAAEIRAIVEGFLVATKPVKTDYIARALPGTDERYLEGLLAGLEQRFAHENRGSSQTRSRGLALIARPAIHSWVRKLDKRAPCGAFTLCPENAGDCCVQTANNTWRHRRHSRRAVWAYVAATYRLASHLAGRAEGTKAALAVCDNGSFLERFGTTTTDDLPKGYEFGAS